jgi:photosystem II stability/assembly factor-like uncharacterized protein
MSIFVKSIANTYFLLGFFVIGHLSLSAQEQWKIVYMNRSPNVFYNITFSDSLNGYVVGQGGIMIKTNDGGTTWDSINSGTNQTLYSVQFANKNIGYACGYNGTIIKTNDAGKTWVLQKTLTTDYLQIIKVISTDTVYAFGQHGRILKTSDGGKTWITLKKITFNDIACIHFYNSKNIILVSDSWADSSIIYSTVNAGLKWKKVSNGNFYINEFSFINSDTGYAIEYFDIILRTTDSCKTWKPIHTIKNGLYKTRLSSIQFSDKITGYVAGDNTLLKTSDGGITWTKVVLAELGNNFVIHYLFITPEKKGFILASVNKKNVIMKSTILH